MEAKLGGEVKTENPSVYGGGAGKPVPVLEKDWVLKPESWPDCGALTDGGGNGVDGEVGVGVGGGGLLEPGRRWPNAGEEANEPAIRRTPTQATERTNRSEWERRIRRRSAEALAMVCNPS